MLLEKPTPTSQQEENDEAKAHNARIQECYRKLQNAEAEQFSARPEAVVRERTFEQQPTTYAPTFGLTPTLEQTPQVTEFVRVSDSSFSAPKTAELPLTETATVVAPTLITAATEPAPIVKTNTVSEPTFSLTSFAKFSICAVAAVVVCALTLIGVNTNALKQADMRISALGQREQALIAQNEEIERRIAEAKSEETIRQYAESQGMIQNG